MINSFLLNQCLRSTTPYLFTTAPFSYTKSLMRGLSQQYLSDMVLQGTSAPKSEWESALRSDLSLATKHPLLDQPIEEAVAIIANTDTWCAITKLVHS